MEKHFELSDSQFEQQFKSCAFNPENFSHEAHLRLAWIHLNNYGIEKAEENITIQLQKFVAFVGAKDKFNLTLTIAALKAVHHFWLQSNTDNFADFIIEFPQLKYSFKALIASHYSFDIYNSPKAKAEYLEPDLLPFD